MEDIKRPLRLLFVLIVCVAILYVASIIFGGIALNQGVHTEDSSIPPPLTAEEQKILDTSAGFAAFISYTDRGFEPREVSIQKGDTIRFTNNSSSDLWIASTGTAENPVYPGTSDCGASDFDTCHVIAAKHFWEFTFDTSGVWTFQNNLDKGKTGQVSVEVQ